MSHHEVQFIRVEDRQQDQRLDNFLFRLLKGVPRSRVYRFIRRGEVRINKKRAKPESRLNTGDLVRIPPFQAPDPAHIPTPGKGLVELLNGSILLENDDLVVLNKPAGIAVHGGSGIRLGLVEAMRQIQPGWEHLELAHRLDRDTSGCLVFSKNMKYLKDIQDQLKKKSVQKYYLALVNGKWPDALVAVDAPLHKQTLESGEGIVRVSEEGKASTTRFTIRKRFSEATLLEVRPETGRTHQIRVHCQYKGHALVGDPKYTSPGMSSALSSYKHLCLHAWKIAFAGPGKEGILHAEAPLPARFQALLDTLD